MVMGSHSSPALAQPTTVQSDTVGTHTPAAASQISPSEHPVGQGPASQPGRPAAAIITAVTTNETRRGMPDSLACFAEHPLATPLGKLLERPA